MKEKIKVWVRNLTKDKDYEIELPLSEKQLDIKLNPNDEYIIIDSEVFDIGEYESIDELNKFLIDCKEKEISIRELEILSHVFLYHEIIEKVKDKNYIIVDFEEATKGWNYGNGGDIWNAYDKGMCLYDTFVKGKRAYNPFKFYVTANIYEWIDWESVWRNATTEGWEAISLDGYEYLVCRYDNRK